jgi:hypothetical protein
MIILFLNCADLTTRFQVKLVNIKLTTHTATTTDLAIGLIKVGFVFED